jgi:oxygen-dependent protoporphyrinogen oxidase
LGDVFSGRSNAPDESLAEFGRRHFGPAATSVLLDAIQVGIFAGDLNQLSAVSAFPQLKQMEREHRSLIVAMIRTAKKRPKDATPGAGISGRMVSLEGGLQRLISALERALEPSIRRSTSVERIALDGQKWILKFRGGGASESFTAERLVLAVPSFVAAELLRPLDPRLAEELAAISYASVAVVHLGYDEKDLAVRPEGLGFLVPSQEARPSLGVLFISSTFPWRAPPGRVLLTCLMGGARNPGIIKLDDEQLEQLARAELKVAMGIGAAPCFRQILGWPRGIPQYNVGHQARLARIDEMVRRLPGLYLTGNAYRGVGINDCVRNAFELAEALRTP